MVVHFHGPGNFLKGVTVGFPVRLSTANSKTVEARVTELRPLSEFATSRAPGPLEYDLNSFLVRAIPTKQLKSFVQG